MKKTFLLFSFLLCMVGSCFAVTDAEYLNYTTFRIAENVSEINGARNAIFLYRVNSGTECRLLKATSSGLTCTTVQYGASDALINSDINEMVCRIDLRTEANKDYVFGIDQLSSNAQSVLKTTYGNVGLNGTTSWSLYSANENKAYMLTLPLGNEGQALEGREYKMGISGNSVVAATSGHVKWLAFYQVYAVLLNAGGGQFKDHWGSTVSSCFMYGTSAMELPMCTPPSGKIFIGWSTTNDDKGLIQNSTYTPTANIELHAIYKSTSDLCSNYVQVTSPDQMSMCSPIILAFQDGDQWKALYNNQEEVEVKDITVSNGTIATVSSDEIMFADSKTSTIYYSGDAALQFGVYYSRVILTKNESYIKKWILPTASDGAYVQDEQKTMYWCYYDSRIRVDGGSPSIKVYMFKKAYTVSYDKADGEWVGTAPASQLALSVTLPTNAKKGELVLSGWTNGIQIFAPGAVFHPTGDVTLTAVYSEVKVSYHAGTGTCSVEEDYGPRVTFPSCTAPTGYRFMGWATSSDATSPQYLAGQSISISKPMDLYAVYTSSESYMPISSLAELVDGDIVALGIENYKQPADCYFAEVTYVSKSYCVETANFPIKDYVLTAPRQSMLFAVEKSASGYRFYSQIGDTKYYMNPQSSNDIFTLSTSASGYWQLSWLDASQRTKICNASNSTYWFGFYDYVRMNDLAFQDQIALKIELKGNMGGAISIFKKSTIYQAKLDANGGQCDVDIIRGNITSLPTASKEGYVFGGWTDGKQYFDAGSRFPAEGNLTSDVTLRAVFADASQQKTVLKKITSLSQLKDEDIVYIVMEDKTGVQYPLGRNTGGGNYRLYREQFTPAMMTDKQYNWEFGHFTSDPSYSQYYTLKNLDNNTYMTASSPSTSSCGINVSNSPTPIELVVVNGGLTMRAMDNYWDNPQYITYNTYPNYKDEDRVYNICTRSSYANQWAENKSLSDYSYSNQTTFYGPGVWSFCKEGQEFICTLTFDVAGKGTLSGNTGDGWTNNVWSGTGTCTLPTVTNLVGYNFIGWSMNGMDVIEGETFAPRENLTLTALYEVIEYTYKFTTDDTKSASVDDVTGSVESPITMPDVTMTNDNYTFQGWCATQGGEVAYVAGEQVTPSANQTWYAKYAAKEYTITFNAGEGTCSTPSAVGSIETQVTFPTPTAPAGYDFVNWKNAADASDVKVAGAQMYPTTNATYIAVYSKKTAIEISQNADPTAMLEALDGETVSVSLVDRTLQANIWNTFCLPFALASLDGTPLAGAQVAEYVQASKSGDEVTLGFNYTTSMEAGKPYLVKPTSAIEHPTFTAVTIAESVGQEVEFEPVTFVATLKPQGNSELAPGDKNVLFLNASAELFYADIDDDSSLPGLRAYFQIASTSQSPVRISFGKMTPTSLEKNVSGIECQKMVIDGKLYIIRNGVMFDAQGAIVK